METELESLEALLASEGWRRFWAYYEAAWGPQPYRQRVQVSLKAANSPALANETVLQIEAATREVERLMTWPAERIKQLRAKQDEANRPPAQPFARTHY